VQGEGPEFSREDWLSAKYKLGLDFPNLPYLIAGDLKVTQSMAILRLVARRAGLIPEDDLKQTRMDMILHQADDLRSAIVRLAYNPDFERLRASVFENSVAPSVASFSRYLGDKEWFCDELTIADFVLYEILDQIRIMEPSLIAEKDNITAFLRRFESLPAIASYMKTDKFIHRPINNTIAQFK